VAHKRGVRVGVGCGRVEHAGDGRVLPKSDRLGLWGLQDWLRLLRLLRRGVRIDQRYITKHFAFWV